MFAYPSLNSKKLDLQMIILLKWIGNSPTMKSIQYDASKKGLEAIFRPWQIVVIDTLHRSSIGMNSKAVTIEVNKKLGMDSISRASIINFLEYLRGLGILHGEDETGKGGHHWVYSPGMGASQYKQFIVDMILKRITEEFPAEIESAIKKVS
jgi:hypothetical protein